MTGCLRVKRIHEIKLVEIAMLVLHTRSSKSNKQLAKTLYLTISKVSAVR